MASLLTDDSSVTRQSSAEFSRVSCSSSHVAEQVSKQVKEISEPECCSNLISLSDSAVGYDDLEGDLISSGMSEQELRDLNSLPDGHFPFKQTITSFSTPDKFGVTTGGFHAHAFEGSMFSPIEEASLVLNSRIADVYALEFCSSPIKLSDSAVLDEDLECDLTSSKMSERELLNLKLPPNGLLPQNWIITSFFTPEKSETVPAGGFHTFDGSRFSPIEEASLVLNSPTANMCASEADKEVETTSENFDLFESFWSWDMSGNVSTEMQIQAGNADSTLMSQLCPTQYCELWAEDINNTSEEFASDKCTLKQSAFGDSCFDCVSFENLRIQNNQGNCLGEELYLSKHQECDSIASYDLTLDLEELEFRKISNEMRTDFIENEANEVVNHWNYNEEQSSIFPLYQSLMQVDEHCGYSYQEPLFLPVTQNSYWQDEDDLESPLYQMDPNCALKKTVVQAKKTKSQYPNRGFLNIPHRENKLQLNPLNIPHRGNKLQLNEGRLPRSKKMESATMDRQVNSEAYRIRLPCLTEDSKPVKIKASKNPFTNSSQWQMDAIGSILAEPKKHWVKQIDKVDCHPNPTSLSNSSVIDDDLECDLIDSELSEQELLGLNLLPDGNLSQNWVSTPISRPEKSKTVTAEGFHSFDGSRFSPIEEASLVLNSPIRHVFSGVVDEEEETTSEDIDLFESFETWEMSGDVSTEMPNIQHENVDSILPLQFHSIRCCDPEAGDVKNISEECTSDDNFTLKNSNSGDSCLGYNTFERLPKQDNWGTCQGRTHYLSQHEVYDRMASSDLTSDLEEHYFGKRSNEMGLCSFEDEANKFVDELVASATKPFQQLSCDSFIDIVHRNYNRGESSILPLEQSLIQLDELNGFNNQEPLFWPLTLDSYWYDEDNMESSLYKIDSECKLNLKIKASNNPSMNFSHLKRNVARSVLAKTMKKQVNEINEIDCCSIPSSLSVSALIDDEHEGDIISFEMSEQELIDLNLLPDGLLPEKWISTPVSTPKKSETVTSEVFHSFDGSRFCPIEEASLILNSPIPAEFVRMPDKETETSSEDIDPFESLQSWEVSGNVSTKAPQIQDGNIDSMLTSQLHITRSILPLNYNSQDLESLSEVDKVGREIEVETMKAELLEVKKQIKELGGLLKCTLRRTDIMQQKFARCRVMIAW